ncbi:type III secretion exporter [Gluconacetobacter diazotrophicus PA1 5]|uniref:Putative flagellar biosynthetic protein flhB n=1 Tax=Gluconacetobacter diazotrophicus (strain ATCC 49037 / DSM 5601 / CCUG 37298 / CIP 103539 / LMG 7603 / PAl5) TaxID=272568 RepID=A9HH78_GLUDA|nr:EscU/YscU/HrcU family type III secretion system export apparatus switch protein [Gluconacetobacter diazotrophicus]ACI53168.1 type III secretion exporter [Gluconacetobacter diazotrophicus PA1 5]TWB10459.1 flagellar biosynthetic protein FlhB [Gluconacetobacter diazotrophicus]CAP55603.1 putative flagellar biosynthetic protein flhB [Gluconacetobacter diazotrophicus PA1 5]
MAEGSGGGEKSQDPTGKRLETAREEGNVAQSRELLMLAILGGFLLVFTMATADSARRFVAHVGGTMEHFDSIPTDMTSIYRIAVQTALEGVLLAAPLVFTGFVVTIACGMLQTGFLYRPQAILPDITRLSPMRGLQRMFGMTNVVEMLKSLTKFVVFGVVLYAVAKGTLHVAPEAERWSMLRLVSELSSWFAYAVLVVLLVQCVIAILDDLWTRYHRIVGLRMSFQDIKDEFRQTEGDPKVKGRLKQMRRRRARRRMLQAVKTATVVITNPTHYAVALSYESGADSAPKIVASGTDELAARIRHAAEDAKVPVVANPPLARALHALPLDSEIPSEYFQPVAAIIAYVMKLKTPGARAP